MGKNYISCSQGHFYHANYAACPHCQNLGGGGGGMSSSPEGPTTSAMDSTVIMDGSGSPGRTVMPGEQTETHRFPGPTVSGGSSDRTIVVGPDRPTSGPVVGPAATQRKLTGWLVSFTLSPFGVDFRLFEGQNNIGRDAKCTVRLSEDSSVSSEHAILLCRNGKYYLQDKMSTNPSFLNGEELPPGHTSEIRDGDELTIGKTKLWIRFAPATH